MIDRGWMRKQARLFNLAQLEQEIRDCEVAIGLNVDLDRPHEVSYWVAKAGVMRLELAKRRRVSA